MWIKVTYAYNDKTIFLNLEKAWRIKPCKDGSIINYNSLKKDDREITVKETPAELFKLMQVKLGW